MGSAPAPLPQYYKRHLYVMSQLQHMPLALGEKGEPSPPLVRGKQKFPKQDEVDSSLQEAESGGRDGRFLLYWITTTSISTSTSYTITYSVSSAACTPASANICGR